MNEPREQLAAAIARLTARILADPDVLEIARAFGQLLREPAPGPETIPPEAADSRPESEIPPTPEPAPPTTVAPSTPPPPIRREPLKPLTLGQSRPISARPIYPAEHAEEYASFDLEIIADRCRLKADGVRWAVERKRRIDAGEDFQERVAPGDRDILERARALPNCFVWMNSAQVAASSIVAADPNRAASLATAFEVAARCAELLHALREDDTAFGLLSGALPLVAEGQSALRVLVEQFAYTKDNDQFELYSHLRQVGKQHGIYIERYMRLEDPADPSRLDDLRDRIDAYSLRLDRERGVLRERKKLFSKLRHHSRLLRDGGGDGTDSRKVVDAAVQLVGTGVPPSSPQIREYVAPILELLADQEETPPGFQMIRREIESLREIRSRNQPEPVDEEPPTPEVAEVASLLRGRSVVMICNVVNPDSRDALIRAFDLSDLDWVVTREHQSIERFKPNIARPDVALVLLPIKWSSHSFGDVKEFCEEHGKVFVQLPAGYNVNQVAVQILNQASQKLRASTEPATANS